MNKILLVEDSKECQVVVKQTFNGPEMTLTIAENVSDAIRLISESAYDLVLLDIFLPDGEGFKVFEHLRTISQCPVFFLTSQDEVSSKVEAFNLGADDYLVKPFNPMELKARVEMRLRKNKTAKHSSQQSLKAGDLAVDLSTMKAYLPLDGKPQDTQLTAKEFKILVQLLQNQGQVKSRDSLVKSVWGESIHVLSRTIDSHVCALRKKLGDYGRHIESIPGVGYRFQFSDNPLTSSPEDQQNMDLQTKKTSSG